MPEVVEALPAFRHLAETEVMAALESYEGNPIARETARLVEGYTRNFEAYIAQLGQVPIGVLPVKPRCAIEAVAMRLTTERVRRKLARKSVA